MELAMRMRDAGMLHKSSACRTLAKSASRSLAARTPAHMLQDRSKVSLRGSQRGLNRERFLLLRKDEREELLQLLEPEQTLELKYDWGSFGPWLIKAGRGWCKSLTGAHWIRAMASPKRWIALIARTPANASLFVAQGRPFRHNRDYQRVWCG